MRKYSPRFKDITGKRFDRLLVMSHFGTHPNGQSLWLCKCDCGNMKYVTSGHLSKRMVRSCGCLAYETRKSSGKKEPGHAAATLVFTEYKKGAKKRNISFTISRDEFIHISTRHCDYCGCKPSRVVIAPGNNGHFICNGIDRVDNGVGYILGNCVPCCPQCNWAKRNLSRQEFLTWINEVYEYAVR